MPGSYLLELELLGNYSVDMPTFEIWRDGTLFGSYPVSSTGTSLSVSIGYGGALPASLEFRFNDASGEVGRTIDIQGVKINNLHVNKNNYLSSDTLTNGGNSTVDVTNSTFLFDASEPGAATFTTGATQTYTGASETYNEYNNPTDQIFDMLGGRDVAYLGAGNDTVSGGAGDDVLRGKGGDDLLFGDLGNDRLYGDEGNDTLYGGGGNDRVHGGIGNDEIHGGSGDDALNGNDGNDVITGGTGNDRLNGGNGVDYLFGGDDNDTLTGGAGNDSLDGGDGDDLIYAGAGDDIINGGGDDDFVIGNDGNDIINGDDGDDTLLGLNDDDVLNGGAGADDLFGGAGDDTINGGTGIDALNGNDGNDTLNGGDGDDNIYGDNGTTIFTSGLLVLEAENFENNIARSGHNWEVVSDATASNGKTLFIDNNGPDDNFAATGIESISPEVSYTVNFDTTGTFYVWIRGRSGLGGGGGTNDSVHLGFDGVQQTNSGGITGFGNDYSWGSTSTTGGRVTVNVTTTGNHTLNLWMREDGVAIDKVIIADTIGYTPTGLGPDANERTSASGGIDLIDGGAGNDTIYGDFGDDIINGGGDDDRIFGGVGQDTINGDAGNDTINGGADDDIISGNNGNDNINGGDGNDTLIGGAGNDDFYGGEGIDVADFSTHTAFVTVDLSLAGQNNTRVGNDSFTDVENIIGTDFNDNLRGEAGVNTIWGGTGNDAIYGYGDADILYGEAGDDDFWVSGTDAYGDTFDGDAGFDEIQLFGAANFSLAETYISIERLDMNGNEIFALNNDGFDFSGMVLSGRANMNGDVGNETMTGTESRDDIYGLAGQDTINGGGGGDYLYGGEDNDTINGDTGNDRLYGGNGVDTINGGEGNDYIYGEDGADILNGGNGDDDFWYQGTEGYGDQVDGGPSGYDELQLTADSYFNLAATFTNIDRLDMNTFDIYALNGDGFDFSGMVVTARGDMFGDVGNETMSGTESRDDIYGRAGNDTINGNAGGDYLYGEEGIDTLNGGDGGDRLYGGDDNDILNGDAGNDFIYGGNGVDTINGGADNDYIYGEDGADILNGGDGNDDFWYQGTEGYGDQVDGGPSGYDEIQLLADSYFDLAATFTNIDRLDMNGFDIYALNNDGFDFSGMTVTARGTMYGDVGDETMSGTESRDDIYGLTGNDTINGNAGGDYIYGGDGVDTINGGADADRIYGGVGADILNGDAGADDFFISGTDGIGDQYNGGADYDDIVLESNIFLDLTTTFTQMERVTFAGFTITANTGTGFDLSGMTRSGTSLLYGQGGDENITGTISTDTIYGLAGSDTLNGNAGNDAIYGGADADILNGGDGNDSFYVSGTESLGDIYDGGAGTDYVRMTADSSFNSANSFTNLTAIINGGFDMLLDPATTIDLSSMNRSGGGGIIGSASADTIIGFANSNIIRGGAGADTITGGTGNDNFYVTGTDSIGDIYDGGTGTDYVRMEGDSYFSSANVFTNIAAIINGGFDLYLEPATTIDFSSMFRSGAGEIIGSTSADTIVGFSNSNLFRGGEGADIMTGGTGGDNFYVSGTEALGDVYNGGAGNDYIRLEGNTEFNSANSFSSIYAIDFNTFDIQLAAGTTIDFTGILRSDTGNIQGSSIADNITGMDNRDYMYGNDGNDTLIGGIGGDFIYGGNGDDIIYGGEDLDYLYGDAGADTFVFENAFAFNDVDRVYTFSTVENDVLDIQDLLSGYTFGVDDLTDFVQIVDSGANSLLRVDTTGTGDFSAPQIATIYAINGLTDEVALETAGTLITH